MLLFVPALRFFVVFLNVYDTFKTLKPPPPSARRGGQPSTRALSQRKRDLKGCLAIWVIWCCYAAYERTFDRVVGIFLPFYGEIKSVFLLFLLLTRAKGAEPLFLHVLLPLVKPYTVVVDPMLELSRDIGDFFFALMQVPLDYMLFSSWFPSWLFSSWFPSWLSRESSENYAGSVSSTHISSSSHSSIPTLASHGGAVQTSGVQTKRPGSIRSVSDNPRSNGRPSVNHSARSRASREWHSKSASATSLPPYSDRLSHDPPRYSQILPRRSGHQIWYPPASAYDGRDFPSTQEVPISTPDLLGTAAEYHSPEWRTYPAFPSAYPPTPLPASASLPTPVTSTTSCSDRHRVSDSAYPPIPVEQGFGELLERQHEGNAGSVCSSSNSNRIQPGVNGHEDNFRQPDEDTHLDDSMNGSEAGLSEDDFDTTLRTPHRTLPSSEALPSSAYSSVDSLTNSLTTADTASSLRMKTSSESFNSQSTQSSSLAGRKRAHRAFHGKAHTTSYSRNTTLRGRLVPPPVLQDCLQSSTSEDDESEVSDGGGAEAKRQKVLDSLQRKTTVRPPVRRAGNTREAPLPTRSALPRGRTVATACQSTTRTGSVTTSNSTIRGRQPPASRLVARREPQGDFRSSDASSSQSETCEERHISQ